jgi:hypothetical protein
MPPPFPGRAVREFEPLQRVGRVGDLKLDDRIVQLARAQLFAEHLARLLARAVTGEASITRSSAASGLGLHLVAQVLAHHDLCGIDKVADDLFHVAPT